MENNFYSLSKLKNRIDHIIKNLKPYQNPDNIPVIVTTHEYSVGAKAGSTITDANMGFDWEAGQFRIETNEKLVRYGNRLQDAKPAEEELFDGKKVYWCKQYAGKVSKYDKYCRHCSQKL